MLEDVELNAHSLCLAQSICIFVDGKPFIHVDCQVFSRVSTFFKPTKAASAARTQQAVDIEIEFASYFVGL